MNLKKYKQKEFCRLTGLTRKALLIYEKDEILPPSHIDSETGYRYYSIDDVIKASKISFLRSLSLGNKKIKDIVENGLAVAPLRELEYSINLAYQQSIHGLQFIHMLDKQGISIKNDVRTTVFLPGLCLSLEGRGNSRDVALHFSILNKHINSSSGITNGLPFTTYFVDSTKNDLHFKVSIPVVGDWLDSHNINGIFSEYSPQKRIIYLTHFGSYELLPFQYDVLYNEMAIRGISKDREYIEIYRTHAIKSSLNDISTLITDIGAVL